MSPNQIAPLTNVGLMASAIEKALARPSNLPGLVVMYGASGLGKTVGATFAANIYRAYYIECRDTWTKKAFLTAVLKEMTIIPTRTMSEMVDQISDQLSRSGRPLIIDDAQYLLDKAAANVLTDIYNASRATIVLIGEERVPASLAKLERLHNRVLEWVPAQPATQDDVRTLTQQSYPGLHFDDDLLESLRLTVRGCLRRVVVNLHRVFAEAKTQNWSSINLSEWGNRGWFTGEPPLRKNIK
jgi:chromosomal replication initiation ATPase DnaA